MVEASTSCRVKYRRKPRTLCRKGTRDRKRCPQPTLASFTVSFNSAIHIDPVNASGEEYHCINNHSHEYLPTHSHQQEIDMVLKMNKEKRIENNQEMSDFEMIEIQKGISESLFTEVILPDTFDINSDKIVIKGAYSLLSKMKVAGEEGHGH